MRAALRSLRSRKPARLVLAVPVAPPQVMAALRSEGNDLVCLSQPPGFYAVGVHYADFHQVSDDEVIANLALLAAAQAQLPRCPCSVNRVRAVGVRFRQPTGRVAAAAEAQPGWPGDAVQAASSSLRNSASRPA